MKPSKRLLEEAQSVMDAYFQDFAPDDAFFRIDDFADWLGKAYGKMADETAKEIYKLSLGETGTGAIIFSQEWWARKTYEIKTEEGKTFAEVDFKTIAFTYDNQNSGIQEVMSAGNENSSASFIRTTLTELWILRGMSKNSIVYWYPDKGKKGENDKIIFPLESVCKPKKIDVFYIPSPEDDNFKLPSNKAFEIATMAYNFMLAAKQGTPFVDMVNNSNKNITPQTETDLKPAKPVGT